jgi:benzoyl-CoA reductase/2-hydroxyglutaryl-CoA dehydratase subunit BcrC/BadD/HgdB
MGAITLGFPIFWWEIPHRRLPSPGEPAVIIPGGFRAPRVQVDFVRSELQRVKGSLEECAAMTLDDAMLSRGIKAANEVRRLLSDLRDEVFMASPCPLPALEMLIAEMLAIHFCSDRGETLSVLSEILDEVRRRVAVKAGMLDGDAARLFWVNPVADLRVMNLVEECGGRICGSDLLFCHALDEIPEDLPPLEALAVTALADPMAGPASDRALRICADIRRYGAEGLVISRIPGASHCATEGAIIGEMAREKLGMPVIEIEVPPISDAMSPALRTRLEALVEVVRGRRNR